MSASSSSPLTNRNAHSSLPHNDNNVGLFPQTDLTILGSSSHTVKKAPSHHRRSSLSPHRDAQPHSRRNWESVMVGTKTPNIIADSSPLFAETHEFRRSNSTLDLSVIGNSQRSRRRSPSPSGTHKNHKHKSRSRHEDTRSRSEKTDWKAESRKYKQLATDLRNIIKPQPKSSGFFSWIKNPFASEDPIINPNIAFPCMLEALRTSDYDKFMQEMSRTVVATIDEGPQFLADYFDTKGQGSTTYNLNVSKAQEFHVVMNTEHFQNLFQSISILSRYKDGTDEGRKFANCYRRMSAMINTFAGRVEQAMEFSSGPHSHIKVIKVDELNEVSESTRALLKQFEEWVPKYLKAFNDKYGERISNMKYRLAQQAQQLGASQQLH